MPKISIIIPVYNSGKYLKRCLNSIIRQTFKDFEIILIDDHSDDNSINIIKKYMLSDDRILLLTNSGKGVSSARNTGLKAAAGDYIQFVDSDDSLNENALHKAYSAALEFNVPVVKFSHNKIKNNISSVLHAPLKTGLYDKTSLNENYLYPMIGPNNGSTFNKGNFSGNVWSFLFSRDILMKNCIAFSPELFFAEDLLFVINALNSCESIYFIDFPLYNYYINPGSVSNSFNPHYIDTVNLYLKKLKQFLIKNNLYEKLNNNYNLCCCRYAYLNMNYIFSPHNNIPSKNKINILKKSLKEDPYKTPLKKLKLNNFNKKYILIFFLLKKRFLFPLLIYYTRR